MLPQMSPIWWMYMIMMIVFCLMIMNSIIYFNYLFKNTESKSFKLFNFNWKW